MALEQIIAYKKSLMAQRPKVNEELKKSCKSLFKALKKQDCSFIFEIKPKSPSKGVLKTDVNVLDIAHTYEPFADAISVLADEKYFGGSLNNVKMVSEEAICPILCKDVVVSPLQVFEARAFGADVVLLMLSVLSDEEYRECEKAARSLGMEIICEVHTEQEMKRAIALKAKIIGINNRDLFSLNVDLENSERLISMAPKGALLISESGFYNRAELQRFSERVNGFLVGSSLMQAPRMDLAVRELIFGRIKICGLTNFLDAKNAYDAGAYYGGLNFWPKSKRYVTKADAQSIKKAPLIWGGVFVDQPLAEVKEIACDLNLDFVQLHGQESERYIKELRAELDCEIWQAIRINGATRAQKSEHAHKVLFDTYCEVEAGGTGKSFPWEKHEGEFSKSIVAGGVDESNVAKLAQYFPFAIDICSGVESENPRKKSLAKIHGIFDSLRLKSKRT